jgi:hypothetical protein
MTNITVSGSDEYFTNKYADPSICSYVYYDCVYCQEPFQLVEPDNNFRAGGAIRQKQYRNKDTNEIVIENRSQGICLECCKETRPR